MKIGIIGGGFYGCHIAEIIKDKYQSQVSIDIFERESALMTRAATNNQCRLHLGFHYPRSPVTVQQTISGFSRFAQNFSNCVKYPKQNYYAVHRDGYLTFEQYLAAMDEHELHYDVLDQPLPSYFREPDDISGIIRVDEGVILLNEMARKLLDSLESKVKIYCDALVSTIDVEEGALVVNGSQRTGYDWIINATYTDSNLGLPSQEQFELKYEIAAMVIVDAPFGDDVGLTIMDGPFVSLYPAGPGIASLSSVSRTPFHKCSSVSELEKRLSSLRRVGSNHEVVEAIIDHGNQLLNLELSRTDVRSVWIAPKTKVFADSDDQRLTEMRVHKKLISVLCGKLDAVYHSTDQIIALIEEKDFGDS